MILNSCETLIKLILLVPLMVYEWLVEPVLLMIFSSTIIPLYTNVLLNIPLLAPVSKKVISLCDSIMTRIFLCLKRASGQQKIEQRQCEHL